MVRCPKKEDRVVFVLKGNIIMEGVVDSDGFENGKYHQLHSCNLGGNRPHAEMEEFVWINITSVDLSQPVKKSGQRTWAKINI